MEDRHEGTKAPSPAGRGRPRPRRHEGWCLIAAVLVSCNGPRGPADGTAPDAPPWEELARTQNDRVDGIERVYGRGVIELNWTDEEGRHFEQGDLDLWLEPPDRAALNITKFGERLFWIGSDGSRTWMFDFRGDEAALLAGDAAGSQELPLEPSLLFALCGLARLPHAAVPVGYDAEHDAWSVAAESRGRAVRLYLDRKTLLPVRVEIPDDAGRAVLFSRLKLSRYERIAVAGRPVGSGPRFPTLVDLLSSDDRLAVKLSVPSPSDDALDERFFELDHLIETFKPGSVDELTGPPLAAGEEVN